MYPTFPAPSQQPQQMPGGGFPPHIPHQGITPHPQPPTSGTIGQQPPFSVNASQPAMVPQPPAPAAVQPVSGIPSLDQVGRYY